MLGSKFVKFLMSILNWQVKSSSIFASFFMAWHITPLYILSSCICNFRQKNAIKIPIWRLSSALVKKCQIPRVNFWKHKPVFLQTFYQSWVQSNITPLYFFSWNIIYFGQNQPIKEQIFEIFECSGQNLLNSSCQFWNGKSILFWITPLHVLSSYIFYFV